MNYPLDLVFLWVLCLIDFLVLVGFVFRNNISNISTGGISWNNTNVSGYSAKVNETNRLNLTYKLQFPEKDNYKLDGTTYDRYTKMESIDFRTENDAVKFLLELKNGKCLTCNMELRNYNGCVYKEGLDLLNDVIKKD